MLTFVIIIIFVIWVASLSGRISRLEEQVKGGKIAAAAEPAHVGDNTRPSLWAQPETAPPPPNAAALAEQARGSAVLPEAAPATPRQQKDEAEIATNWLNKIGVVAVLLGMGLFFKYAVDQNWITPWMRIALGFAVGGLFVFLGWLWREKYAKYANVMMGGGIALWYFTIFAGYDFYGLFPQFAALALMVLASICAVVLAYYRQSLALAVLGLLGAYGAPVALSSGENRQMQLLVYLTVLNLAVLAILAKKYWSGLALFAVFATWIDFSYWFVKFSSSLNAVPSVIFFMVFVLLFFVGLAAVLRRHALAKTLDNKFSKLTSLAMLLTGFVYLIYIQDLLAGGYHAWLLGMGLFASLAAFLAYALIDRLEFEEVNYSLSFAGAALLLAAFSWQWDRGALCLAVVLAGGAGAGLAYALKRKELRLWSTLTLLYSLVLILALPYAEAFGQLFVLNFKFGLMVLEVAALFYAAWLYSRSQNYTVFESHTDRAFNFIGIFLLWAGLSWDISHFFPSLNGEYGLALWWILYPLLLGGLGTFAKRPGLIKAGLLLTAFALLRSLSVPYPAESAAFIFNFKFGLMVLETAALFVLAHWARVLKTDKYAAYTSEILGVIGALFLWLVVTLDVFHAFTGIGQDSRVAFWWAIYPVLLIYFARLAGSRLLARTALGLLVLGFFRVVFLGYGAEDYMFMLNAKFGLMLLQVLALLVMVRFLPDEAGKEKAGDFMKVTASLLLWFAFSWELVRYFARPEDGNTRNLLMSLWWIAYAAVLITIGAVARSPLFRKVALALFGASILKVFLFDALALETGYRIVSFIVLGVILLSVSYAYQRHRGRIVEFLEGDKKGVLHV